MNFKEKRVTIFGLQGSGKSNLTKFLLKSDSNHLVYDTLQEYDKFNTYTPQFKDGSEESRAELSEFIKHFVIGIKKLKTFVIDEANIYCHAKPRPLPEGMVMLNDWSRHEGISMILISRRPTQMHTDLVELAHYVIFFNLKGVRDQNYMDSLLPELGEKVASLKPYHFIVMDQNRNITEHKPIALMK